MLSIVPFRKVVSFDIAARVFSIARPLDDEEFYEVEGDEGGPLVLRKKLAGRCFQLMKTLQKSVLKECSGIGLVARFFKCMYRDEQHLCLCRLQKS